MRKKMDAPARAISVRNAPDRSTRSDRVRVQPAESARPPPAKGASRGAARARVAGGARVHRLGRDAEIVCGNDNPSQVGRFRRARRKWKNSTPSRKRRFIISGLAIISARMAAIFEGRK